MQTVLASPSEGYCEERENDKRTQESEHWVLLRHYAKNIISKLLQDVCIVGDKFMGGCCNAQRKGLAKPRLGLVSRNHGLQRSRV